MALRKVSGALLIDTKNPDVALEPTFRRRQPNESLSRTAGRRALPLVEPWEPSLKTARCTVYPFRKIVSTWSPTARVPLEVQQRTAQTTGPVQLPLQPRRGLPPGPSPAAETELEEEERELWDPMRSGAQDTLLNGKAKRTREAGWRRVTCSSGHNTQDGGRRLRRLRRLRLRL